MFTFAWPWFFLLLPLPWLIVRFAPRQAVNRDAMLRVPFLQHLPAFNSPASPFSSSHLKWIYGILAWSFLLIACANPTWLGDPLPIQQEGRNIMLAVDLSPSMSIPDLQQNDNQVTRLDSVKTVAANFIDKRQGDKLGLILFGSKAYIQTPLTFDRNTIRTMLDDATIGLAGDHTAIGDALGLAVQKLQAEDVKSRILILLTDGGNNTGLMDPLDATELAKKNQVKIYTVGIGASQLEIRNEFGAQMINPSADLDETLLKSIAGKTHGKYYRAEDQAALNDILESINQLEPVSSNNKTARPIAPLFYWPLALALIFLSLLIFPSFEMKLKQ